MLRRTFIALISAISFARGQTPAPGAPETVPPPAPETAAGDKPVIEDDATRVAVLGYHDFSETLPETAMRMRTSKFRKQMEAIRQLGLNVITLEDFLAWKHGEKTLPERCVLITLDDGWKSVYTDAYPILKEFGYPFSLYLYKEYVDGGGKALTTDMVKEMMANGASIGSHSVTHPYPAVVKGSRKKGAETYDAFLRKEMGESMHFLQTKFPPSKVTTFAYPGGFHTEEMYPLAKEFGYTALFTVIPAKVKRSTPDMTVPRYMILGNYDKIFELATSFRDGGAVAGSGGLAPQKPPVPVSPEAGSIINSRMPVVMADLSTIPDLDPATLVMKIGGFGEVPATFDPATKRLSWHINRKLRYPTCQVVVNWKDIHGKPPEIPLRWSFQIDRTAAYLPEDEP